MARPSTLTAIRFLNEVLSITAQESSFACVLPDGVRILNEVLSITAQEFVFWCCVVFFVCPQ